MRRAAGCIGTRGSHPERSMDILKPCVRVAFLEFPEIVRGDTITA
jgi:hypothetical protein